MSDETRPSKPSTPPRWFVKSFWVGHRAVLRVSRGRLGLRGARPDRWGMLQLRTVGRHSGKEREAILAYIEDGENLVLLATNGMDERPPAWWLNLQAQPDASVRLSGGSRDVQAREVAGEERERLWTLWSPQGDGSLDTDAAALERQIPVIVLEPRAT